MADWTPDIDADFQQGKLLKTQSMSAITQNDLHNRNGENLVIGEIPTGPTGTGGIGSAPLTYTLSEAHQSGTLTVYFNGRRVPRINKSSDVMWTADSATQFSFTQAWQTNWIAGNAIDETNDEVLADFNVIEPT